MKQIWKFPLTPGELNVIEVPFDAEILSVGCPSIKNRLVESDYPVVWVLGTPTMNRRKMRFKVIGTGWDFDDYACQFIGTAYQTSGLVWHIFYAGIGE